MLDPSSIASTPRRIRLGNEVAALGALYRSGRLSRADLARELRLNRSSSGHIVAGLTAGGLVREVAVERAGAAAQRAGRPGILLELVPDAAVFVGIEIGVEHLGFVELDLAGNVVDRGIEPYDGPSIPLDEAFALAGRWATGRLSRERWARCEGVGVSVPAQMDKTGFIRIAPLLGWRDVHPAERLRGALPPGIPVLAQNDANAFAIGDTYMRGAPRGGVTLFLVMESGIGGGIVVDGTLFRGGNGLAGEIGHLRLPHEAGGERSLEQVIGREAILSAYRRASPRSDPSFEQFLADVEDRAPAAVAIGETWAKALAFGLVQACRIVDPDRIVLGGSVALLYPLVAARVAFHLAEIQEPSFPMPSIVVNENAAFGSAFGAACMMHQRYLSLESQRFSEDPVPADPPAAGHDPAVP
ncbi:MAG: ROK family transcriptional regulator [Methylobacterium sp.]